MDVSGLFDYSNQMAQWVVSNGENFQQHLDNISKLTGYKAANQLIISGYAAMYGFQASELKTMEEWQKQGVDVVYDQPIEILQAHKNENEKWGYDVKVVYDIRSTNGMHDTVPIPPDDALEALIASSPVNIQVLNDIGISSNSAIYVPEDNVIRARRGAKSYDDCFKGLAQEVAHAVLAQHIPAGEIYARAQNYFSAYSAGYILCKKYNIDTSGFDFSSLPDYAAQKPDQVRQHLNGISSLVYQMDAGIRAAVKDISKRRDVIER